MAATNPASLTAEFQILVETHLLSYSFLSNVLKEFWEKLSFYITNILHNTYAWYAYVPKLEW